MTYIKFQSQTYGEKAVMLLKRYNINSILKRNPNPNHREGCNYALFANDDIFEAYEIISSKAIPNLGLESFGDTR